MPLTCHRILPWTQSAFQAAAHPVGMDSRFPASLYPDRGVEACLHLYMKASGQSC